MRHKVSLLLLSSGQLDRRRVLFTAARKARRVLRVVTTVKTRFDASRVSRVTRGAINSPVGAKQCRHNSTTVNDLVYVDYTTGTCMNIRDMKHINKSEAALPVYVRTRARR